MAWHVVERANRRKYLATYETEKEAQEHRARLIAQDPVYEDVLLVRHSVGDKTEADAQGGESA